DSPSLVRRWSSELGQLLRGSAFIFSCWIAGAGLTLAVQVLLARSMGAEELGGYTLAFSWCVLLANASTLGFIPAAVRFVGEGRVTGTSGYVRAFVRFATRTTMLTGICVAVIGIAIARWRVPDGIHGNTMIAALATVPVLAAMHLMGGITSGFGCFALGFLPTSVIRPLLFFALVALLWAQGRAMNAETAMYVNLASVVAVALPVFALSWALVAREDAGERTAASANDGAATWLRS